MLVRVDRQDPESIQNLKKGGETTANIIRHTIPGQSVVVGGDNRFWPWMVVGERTTWGNKFEERFFRIGGDGKRVWRLAGRLAGQRGGLVAGRRAVRRRSSARRRRSGGTLCSGWFWGIGNGIPTAARPTSVKTAASIASRFRGKKIKLRINKKDFHVDTYTKRRTQPCSRVVHLSKIINHRCCTAWGPAGRCWMASTILFG